MRLIEGRALRGHLRDACLCLSLANLLWIRPWAEVLNRSNLFYFERGAGVGYFLSPLAGVLISAIALRVALRWTRTSPGTRVVGTWGFLILSGLALNAIRTEIPALSGTRLHLALGGVGFGVVSSVGAFALAWVLAAKRSAVVRGLRKAVLVLTPFLVVTTARGWQAYAAEQGVQRTRSPVPLSNPRPGPRVVVVLFDGMDVETALGLADREKTLPAFSRLLSEAVHFEKVIAPPGRKTLNSLPSITLGRLVVASEPSGRSDLKLSYADGSVGLWSAPPNVFRIARAEGVNSFVAGWSIPYCRIFGKDVANCSWRPYLPRPDSIADGLRRHVSSFWTSVPGAFRLASLAGWRPTTTPDRAQFVEWHMNSYLAVHARGLAGVRDPGYRLVFLHYPVPHEPMIFDRSTGALSPTDGDEYLDNQVLADRALGELRAAMVEAGTWENSTVLVMSDHAPKNQAGVRHPVFIVKVPGAHAPYPVTDQVNLFRASDLILGVLRGQVQTPSDAVGFVRATSTHGTGPRN